MISNVSKPDKENPDNVHFLDILEDYRLSLEAGNRSAKTILWYMEILQRYFRFLESNHLAKPVKQLGSQELKAYVLHLQQSEKWAGNSKVKKSTGKLSPHSIQGHVRALKAFWSWLEKERVHPGERSGQISSAKGP